jgi:nucleotide-binding universal stress UspA family protein
MIKTILVCVDGSKYSKSAADLSIWIAHHLKAEIQALSVVDIQTLEGPWLADLTGLTGIQPFQSLVPQLRDLTEKKCQSAVQEVLEAAKKRSVKCQTHIRTGHLVEEILQAEHTAELIVLGQRGEGFEMTGEWLGSNVDRVIRKSIKPCLISTSEFRPIRSILMAYDGSEHANHALYSAIELAQNLKAKLTILSVESSSDEEKMSWALKEAMDISQKQGTDANALALHGSPEETILKVASEQHHDLIVMGAYGHTRLRELILGSVTSHVIRKSAVPVLLSR